MPINDTPHEATVGPDADGLFHTVAPGESFDVSAPRTVADDEADAAAEQPASDQSDDDAEKAKEAALAALATAAEAARVEAENLAAATAAVKPTKNTPPALSGPATPDVKPDAPEGDPA